MESRAVVARGWGAAGGVGVNTGGYGSPLFGVMRTFGNFTVVLVVQHRECVKCHRTAHSKVVTVAKVMLCVLQ